MSRLANSDHRVLSETDALRDRRAHLLRKAENSRYRLQNRKALLGDLQQVTNELLKRELEARQEATLQPATRMEPMGDAGAVGGYAQGRLPYKD